VTASRIKANGIHYTPTDLAAFLAEVMADHVPRSKHPIEVLDPACGNGSLLRAFAEAMPPPHRSRLTLVGFETDHAALAVARSALSDVGVARIVLHEQDFLSVAGIEGQRAARQMSLLETESTESKKYDVIIANPPYVRTQVLGSRRAQQLARRFNLTGRVDLYHAFATAMVS
jgi:type I restriction-modification system DNA methylase subunit